MITHAEAKILFKKCRNKERGYKLTHNTYLLSRGNAFAIKLHETDVVTIRPDETYRLNTGGYRTATTKNRMNLVLPCCVSQKNGIWYAGDTYYMDRMLIGSNGKAIGAKTFPDIQKIKTKVDHKVNKFIKMLTQAYVGCDIGTWESFKGRVAPRPSNKTHLRKLWGIVNQSFCNYDMRYRLLYWATLSCHYNNPGFIWELMRQNCLHNCKPIHALNNLRAFMRPRKPLIAEMIAKNELTL